VDSEDLSAEEREKAEKLAEAREKMRQKFGKTQKPKVTASAPE
jgi:hypothetical protein